MANLYSMRYIFVVVEATLIIGAPHFRWQSVKATTAPKPKAPKADADKGKKWFNRGGGGKEGAGGATK